MNHPFFAMLFNAKGTAVIPLVTDDPDNLTAMFATRAEAQDAAEDNPMGNAYGYQIFEVDDSSVP